MRQASKRIPESAEKTVRDIRRATRRHHSAEEKIRIVLEGLRGEDSIAELCRKEGINQNLYLPRPWICYFAPNICSLLPKQHAFRDRVLIVELHVAELRCKDGRLAALDRLDVMHPAAVPRRAEPRTVRCGEAVE
jgi:hypothetical protein